MKLTERHQTPEACDSCPNVQRLRVVSEMVEDGLTTYIDVTTGAIDRTALRGLLTESGAQMQITDDEADELLGLLAQELPAMFPADEMFDQASVLQGRIEHDAVKLEEGCPGVFRIRATDKLGYTVTASLCGSPLVRLRQLGGPTLESAVVRVKRSGSQ